MEYFVIESSNLADLISQINKYLAAGWRPKGGIACTANGHVFCQAIVRGR